MFKNKLQIFMENLFYKSYEKSMPNSISHRFQWFSSRDFCWEANNGKANFRPATKANETKHSAEKGKICKKAKARKSRITSSESRITSTP
jgi:hypothetical protein